MVDEDLIATSRVAKSGSATWFFRLVFAFSSMRSFHAVRSATVSTSSLAARRICVCSIFPSRQESAVNYLFANVRGSTRAAIAIVDRQSALTSDQDSRKTLTPSKGAITWTLLS